MRTSRAGRSVIVTLAAGSLLPAVLRAQAPEFSAQTELVVIDAVVTDPGGIPVGGLTREDFTVLEDGRPVELSSFEAVSLPASPLARVDRGRSPLLPAPAPHAEPQPRGLMVVVFDDLHLGRAAAERGKTELRRALEEPSMGALELVLLSTAGGGAWRARLPEDRDQIEPVLARFRGAAPPAGGGRMTDQEAYLIAVRRDPTVETQVYRRYLDFGLLPDPTLPQTGRQKRTGGVSRLVGGEQRGGDEIPAINRGAIRAEAEALRRSARERQIATFDGLRRILDSLVERPGRKALVLVSQGFERDPSIADERGFTEAARRAKATVHFLDTRDPSANLPTYDGDTGQPVDLRDLSDTLRRVASDAEAAESAALATGGRIVHGTRNAMNALRVMSSELRTYYLLGYSPPERDGSTGYRHVEVSVKRPGLKVQARPGYYPGGTTADTAQAPPLEPVVEGGQIPARLAAFVAEELKDGQTRIQVMGEADLPERAKREGEAVSLAFELVARDRRETHRSAARVTFDGTGDASRPLRGEATFDVEPGVYQAWFGVRVEGAGEVGATRRLVEVPKHSGLRLSTPVLTDRVEGTPPDVQLARRVDQRFAPDATLYVGFEVLGSAPGETVSAGFEVRSGRGELVRRGAATPLVTSGHRSRLWAVPLTGLAPGPYRLVLQAEGSKQHQPLTIPADFEITPPVEDPPLTSGTDS